MIDSVRRLGPRARFGHHSKMQPDLVPTSLRMSKAPHASRDLAYGIPTAQPQQPRRHAARESGNLVLEGIPASAIRR